MKRFLGAAALATVLSSGASWAIHPEHGPSRGTVAQKAFFNPELSISSNNVELREARAKGKLNPARERALSDFLQRYGKDTNVYLEPRSGAVSGIHARIPMIPGDGMDNRVTLSGVGQSLGRAVSTVDESLVGELVVRFARDHAEVLGIDPSQLGTPRVTQVTEHLWQVHIPQQIQGIPVREGRLAATLSHGNLVLIGTEGWADVKIRTLPLVAADQALERGLARAGLAHSPKSIWKDANLEVVPTSEGEGYGHKLVWAFGFQDEGDDATWEVLVDAHKGEVIALEDKNQYLDASITGGVYPLTNTEICPTDGTCGSMQANYPMPWANTGLVSPNNFTNGAGVFSYTSGTVTTTLSGKYIGISDRCGTVSNGSTTGNLNLGGTNGQHDCTTGGGSTGNTPAARAAFYELNKLAEQARGWLPSNTWVNAKLTANVNIASTCNAYWSSGTVNFYRSGGGCRNTGEIGAVFDHEWGHGMDDNDANGTLSASSEGYADIAAIYRLQTSCVGHGFFATSNRGCGMTADGTGYNQNEAQSGAAHCDLNCSGVRDADWASHSDNTPDTPQNHVCVRCTSSTGLCGRQTHCAAAPTRQAAWDLVARDLRAAPFNYDANTAFIVGNKLFYQGSGNVGSWHACDCTAKTSSGCGSTNGYMQWLAADDDNGNLADGTPHMTAIYNAFNRHNIACATPAPQNGGCSTGPTATPSVTLTPGTRQVALSWSGVTNAAKYWVLKTEGHAGCNFGKALKATVTGTTWTDSEVLPGRPYCYSVVAAGSSNACYTQASTCSCVTPN
ncbi:hypothetical protein ATI61_101863 [Archangium gephyra]|uniref:Uncharacterized protein n=1 Tax=Archangium gephyra TaxID=48 RepID=A0AAC8QB67_9BACT